MIKDVCNNGRVIGSAKKKAISLRVRFQADPQQRSFHNAAKDRDPDKRTLRNAARMRLKAKNIHADNYYDL